MLNISITHVTQTLIRLESSENVFELPDGDRTRNILMTDEML